MKKTTFKASQSRFQSYTAPVCDLLEYVQDTICTDSVGVGSEDFEKGDDYVW